jgi:two-component system sensor histidine kinase VicK
MKGTGLGLAISKEIISRHGGKIWAESQLGHGSRIIFVLPADLPLSEGKRRFS